MQLRNTIVLLLLFLTGCETSHYHGWNYKYKRYEWAHGEHIDVTKKEITLVDENAPITPPQKPLPVSVIQNGRSEYYWPSHTENKD